MRALLIRFFINAVCLGILVSGIVPGIRITGNTLATLVVVAVIFGVINAFVKPLVQILTCPFIVFSLGLFLFIINALMLQLTAWLSSAAASAFGVGGTLMIDGFGWALVGAVIVTIVNFVMERLIGVMDRPTRVVIERRVEVREIVRDRRAELDRDFNATIARAEDDDFNMIDPNTGRPR